MTPDALLPHLARLEQLLHQPATRRDPAAVARLLAEDFREFGASGRTYDKQTILELLAGEPESNPITTTDYHLTLISSDAALLTYRATRAALTTLRSSLWVQRGNRWQMLFHQGTSTAD